MMRMVMDMGRERGGLQIMNTPTSVDCGRGEVRFRRSSFRSLVECIVPACCGSFQHPTPPTDDDDDGCTDTVPPYSITSHSSCTSHHHEFSSSSTRITGTFFGYRKGRVSFCLQYDTRSSPLLLLEFAVPTAYLAKEMQHGLLRIALVDSSSSSSSCSLFNVPVWSMYCNGRKVGFAIRRQMTRTDASVLNLMHSVSVGAGVLPPNPNISQTSSSDHNGDLIMYLRASFHRVIGSLHSQSFHIINPVGSSAQELSIFLLRSS